MKKIVLWCLAVLFLTAPAYAQDGAFVRLTQSQATGTLSPTVTSLTLSSSLLGGFGVVKVQTLDSYSGTWKVQCSLNGTTYDTTNVLKVVPVGSSTTATSVTDTVGIWDVMNAGACKTIKVLESAGFAATDTALIISATQAGGASLPTPTIAVSGSDVDQFNRARVTTLASIATPTITADNNTDATIIASNGARLGAECWNDSTAILYINYGATASTTAATEVVQPNGQWIMLGAVYTGAIHGIWSANASGSSRCTELTQ